MTKQEGKLGAKEEELKNNEIELVEKNERFERAQAQIGLVKGSLPDSMLKTGLWRTN